MIPELDNLILKNLNNSISAENVGSNHKSVILKEKGDSVMNTSLPKKSADVSRSSSDKKGDIKLKKPTKGNPKVLTKSRNIVDTSNIIKDNSKVASTSKKKMNIDTAALINENFSLMVCVFTKTIPNLTKEEILLYVKSVTLAHNDFLRNLGVKFGTSHYKDIVNYCILLCEGRSPEGVSRVSTGKTDKWPNCFGSLRPIFRNILNKDLSKEIRSEYFRLLLTLFKLNKVCKGFSEIEVDGIQKDFKLDQDFLNGFENYIKKRFNDTDPTLNLLNLRSVDPIFGPANGPNGFPKVETSKLEALELVNSKLFKHFKKMCELTGNHEFLEYVKAQAEDELQNPSQIIKKSKDGKLKPHKILKVLLRKLVSIPDKGNKSRTVAICDFWTQSLLAPLEKNEERFLERNFKDRSAFYSHSQGFKKALDISNRDWVSLDATSWTDNFPVQLQYIYVKHMYGEDYAKCWKGLATECDWAIGNTGLTVKYGKGQGMGTKGSFMIASVTDHVMIEYVLESHYGKVMPYLKVGDDLVVEDRDNKLLSHYPTIGVPININKSKLMAPNGHFMEFVSRNSWDGLDISPVSPLLLYKAIKQPFLLIVLLNHLKERTSFNYTLDILIESINMKEVERVKLYQLVDFYQRITGNIVCTIPPDIKIFTKGQYCTTLIKMLQLSSAKVFGENLKLANSNLELYNKFVIYREQIKSGVYKDAWHFYNTEKVSINDLKIFSYFKSNIELFKPKIVDNIVVDGMIDIEFLDSNNEVTKELNKFILDTYIMSCTELVIHKSFSTIANSNTRDAKQIIDLFKSFNTVCKERDVCVSYSPRFTPHIEIVDELKKFL